MSEPKPPRPPEDEIIYLDDDDESGDEVARALAEAERAVTAVERKHKGSSPEIAGMQPVEPRAGAATAVASPADELDSLNAKVGALEQALNVEKERAVSAEEEAGRMREALMRKNADFDNVKRRTEREKTDFFKFALAETFRDLLGILDNLNRALLHVKEKGSESDIAGGEDFRVGIEMIARQFADTLKKYGLSEVPAEGASFNPNFHEAVVREETDSAPPGTVLEVLQKGYILNERLLRPALVKVAAAPRPSGEAS